MIVVAYIMSYSFETHKNSPSAARLHQCILTESNDPIEETKQCEMQKKIRNRFHSAYRMSRPWYL